MLNISEDRITRKETLNIYILFLNFSCKKIMCFKTMDYLLNVQMFSQFVCVCMFVCECFPFFQCLRLAQGYHLQSRDSVIEDRFIFPQII